MDKSLSDRFSVVCAIINNMKNVIKSLELSVKSSEEKSKLLSDSIDFLYKFSEFTRNEVKSKLENITNLALSAVFPDKTILLKVVPTRNKKGLFYDLYAETDGFITPLDDCKGGGVLDIVSICLRISYLRIFKGQLRQVLILDEPFKNIDSVRFSYAIDWLSSLSNQMEIQFIIVTHIKEMITHSDKSYTFQLKNGVTCVSENV